MKPPHDIQTTISHILTRMGARVRSVEVRESNGRTFYSVHVEDGAQFTQNKGEVLKALNTVVRAIHDTSGAKPQFTVDVNDFYSSHVRALQQKARSIAARAKTFKYDIEMPPMSSYDRMIVHEALKDDEHVSTESRGEGRLRHVVISFKK